MCRVAAEEDCHFNGNTEKGGREDNILSPDK